MRFRAVGIAVALGMGGVAVSAAPAGAALPAGFSDTVVVSGLNFPTAFDFAPDGRLFIAEHRGVIKVYDDIDDTTPTIFADMRTEVLTYQDRGMLGIVVDPLFPTRPYVYVHYVYDAPPGGVAPTYGTPGGDSDSCPTTCIAQVRVSRLVANGNTATSQTVLFKDLCHVFSHHDGGGMAMGTDGALHVSFGEAASTGSPDYGATRNNPCGDPPTPAGVPPTPPGAEGGALRAQDLRTSGDPASANGAVIRIDPDTGAGWPGNPFAGSADLEARKVIAYGLRNPYRLALRPGTNEVWIGDVGWSTWEEINRVASPGDAAENFGWPCYEGAPRQPGYDAVDLSICEDLYAQPSEVIPPYFSYHHEADTVPGDGCRVGGGGSVTGLRFYTATGYPARYRNGLFFTDLERRCIWFMPVGTNGLPNPAATERFATNVGATVDLRTGPGGDIFYLEIDSGTLHRLHFDAGNAPPTAVITANPPTGPAPLTTTLSAASSTDTDPGATLTYAWDSDNDGAFDDGTGVTKAVTFASRGAYTVRLRVRDNVGATVTTSLVVTVGTPPVATIDTPAIGTRWSVGEQINFTGHATDLEDGTLGSSALSWSLILHHCSDPNDCHQHHVQNFSGSSGSFIAPDHEYLAKLELQLTATDSDGVTNTASTTLDPRLVLLTFHSEPSGLTIAAGNRVGVTPFSLPMIIGSRVALTAATPQVVNGEVHRFSSWSNGGAVTHEVVVGAQNTTYTATFENIGHPPTANAGPDLTVKHRQSFTLDGSGSGDADNEPLSYEWVQIAGPAAVIPDNRLARAYVQGVKGPATLTFQLTVTDTRGLTHTDTVMVTVNPK